MERASAFRPRDAGILNDLAVIYVVRAERDQELVSLLKALNTVEQALTVDTAFPAALFNRALIMERLFLAKSAHAAWSRYLAVDGTSKWAAEAQRHLDVEAPGVEAQWWRALGNSLSALNQSHLSELEVHVTRSPQSAREFSYKLWGEWGAAVVQGDTVRRNFLLSAAERIARVLENGDVDIGASRTVRALRAKSDEPAKVGVLGMAHHEFALGITQYSKAGYDTAIKVLTKAEEHLKSAGSPALLWATFYRAAAEINRGDFAPAELRLRQIIRRSPADEPALRGKAIWALGVSQLRKGAYDSASFYYRAAVQDIERSNEAENRGAIAYLLAEGLQLSGDPVAGMREALRGLNLLAPYQSSSYFLNLLSTVAAFARANALPYAALAMMDEVVVLSQLAGSPQTVAWAHRARARDLIKLGRANAARQTLEEAEKWAGKISAGRGRDRVQADIALVLSQLDTSTNPGAAVARLERVVETYRRLNINLTLVPGLHEMARAAQAARDTNQAADLLEQAVQQIELQRLSFETADSRASFYETVEAVFDDAIGVAMDAQRPQDAFRYLERARAAVWNAGDAFSITSAGRTPSIPKLNDLVTGLDSRSVFIEYALLEKRLIVWAAIDKKIKSFIVPISRDSISRLVQQFEAEADDPDVTHNSARATLFEVLLRPLVSDLHDVRRLVVVPDRELFGVPFAALWNSKTGRYVVQEFEAIQTLPSAAFMVSDLGSRKKMRRVERALVIGNPSTDSVGLSFAAARKLPNLPGAAREASRIAQQYPQVDSLMGRNARYATVLQRLSAATVFHFAGHAVSNADRPERSYLSLSQFGDDERIKGSAIRAQEIGRLRLSNLSLVVLSACSTLNPRPSRIGPISGLAFSFLRAGVPATVSTLWSVNDDVSTDLLVRFHQQYSAGKSPGEALVMTQRQALSSSQALARAPRAWASFIYTGP